MTWLSDVEWYLFTCSYPADQKVKCALNLLRSRAKDRWKLVTDSNEICSFGREGEAYPRVFGPEIGEWVGD